MKLRNQAVQRGTSALISTQTHVENGSKIAKGQDAVGGIMSQFSSLMSVMQDDFAMMSDMEREYEGEKSAVEPTLPDEVAVAEVDDKETPIFDEHREVLVPESVEQEDPEFEKDYSMLLADTVPLSLQEMTEHPALFEPVSAELPTTPAEQSYLVVYVLQAAVHLSTPVPQATPVLNEVATSMPVQPAKQVVVSTPQEIPEVLVKEVVQAVQPMLVEEVEVVDDTPRFEQSERLDLPEYMREEVRLLDDVLVETDDADLLKSVPLRELFETSVQQQSSEQVQTVIPQQSDVQAGLQAVMNGAIPQGVQTAQAAQVVQSAGGTVDGVSIQQQKSAETVKSLKLPKAPLTRQHFEELLEESQQKGTEQMGFRTKLLQRLEMVIMDPMGRMDVEVAQEVSGVNVKAVVPVEIVSSLSGLESDLQVALEQQGLELNNFELYERSEGSESQGTTDGFDDDANSAENDLNEKTLTGGMLVNRRV